MRNPKLTSHPDPTDRRSGNSTKAKVFCFEGLVASLRVGRILAAAAATFALFSLESSRAQPASSFEEAYWNPEAFGIADYGLEFSDVLTSEVINVLLSDAGIAQIIAIYPNFPLPQVGETVSEWGIRIDSWIDSFGGNPVPSGSVGVASPSPQTPTYRAVNSLISRMVSRQSGAVAAGSGWGPSKAPVGSAPYTPSVVHTPYVEYGYIDLDNQRRNERGGHIHTYALGYDLAWDSGAILGINYEYADISSYGLGGDGDSHTIAAYGSIPFNQWNGLLIGGYTEGSTNFGPIRLNSDAWFINPGVSRSWDIGNLVLNTTLSYLYIDSSIQDWGTLIPELGARYFLSDSLHIGSSIQYNSVVSHSFLPGAIDPDWWRFSAEVGVRVRPNALVTLGYDHDFSHRIQELHTARIGLSIDY